MESTITFAYLKYPYDGYVAIEGDLIYISVISITPSLRGKGFFRKFIEDTKKNYKTIRVPQPSPVLKEILSRYGFTLKHEWFESAEMSIEVMEWKEVGK